MENASKALIIAGAILLAILLISLGIGVYTNAKNQVSGNDLTKEQIQAFNSKWENFTASKQTSSQISQLFSEVIASNAAEKRSTQNKIVTLTYGDNVLGSGIAAAAKAEPSTIPMISSSSTYTVTATYSDGLITELTITK